MKFFKSNNRPGQKAFVGSNLAIITKGSSTYSPGLASPDEGTATMTTQGHGPSAPTTVSGDEVQRAGLGLGRGWCTGKPFPNSSMAAGNG